MNEVVQGHAGFNYGAWYQRKEDQCKLCAFSDIVEVHRLAYERVPYDKIVAILKKQYNFEVSKATLSRHFKFHFALSDNREAILKFAGVDEHKTSIDSLISDVEERRVTLIEGVSKIAKSKLESLKKYEEITYLIEKELGIESQDGELSGYTATDKHNDALFKRWAYLQKETNALKNEISGIIFNVQNVVQKNDQDSIKNYMHLTKLFLLKNIVPYISNALVDLGEKGVLDEEQVKSVGNSIANVIKVFENKITIDMLFQQALNSAEEQDKNS